MWKVAEGRGRKPRLSAEDVARIVDATLQTKPAGATHWSCRTKVIGQCYVRHRHQEFLKFLQRLDAEFPDEVTLHWVMDNYGTRFAQTRWGNFPGGTRTSRSTP